MREREILLSRAAQQFSSNAMNLDGQISKGVLSCSDRQAACCKHVQANARSCARFHFSSSLNQPGSVLLAYLCIHMPTDALFTVFPRLLPFQDVTIYHARNVRSTVMSQQACLSGLILGLCTLFFRVTTTKIFFCEGPVWAYLSLIAE